MEFVKDGTEHGISNLHVCQGCYALLQNKARTQISCEQKLFLSSCCGTNVGVCVIKHLTGEPALGRYSLGPYGLKPGSFCKMLFSQFSVLKQHSCEQAFPSKSRACGCILPEKLWPQTQRQMLRCPELACSPGRPGGFQPCWDHPGCQSQKIRGRAG